MRRFPFIVLIILFSLACSCTQKHAAGTGTNISIDPTKEGNISIFDLISKVELVQLEDLPEALVAEETVKDIAVTEDGFLLLDRRTFFIRKFDRNGRFVMLINKVGRGHGEFQRASAIQLDEDSTLLVLQATGGITRYDLRDDITFVEQIPIEGGPRAVHHFVPIGGKRFLLFSASDPARLYLFDSGSGKSVPFFEDIPRWLSLSFYYDFQESPFYKRDGQVFFYTGHDGAVFRLDATTSRMVPVLSWDLGPARFDPSDLTQEEASVTNPGWEDIFNQRSNHAVLRLSRVNESARFVLASGVFKEQPISLVYDKKQRKGYAFRQVQEGVLYRPRFTNDEIAYTLLSPENVKKYVTREMIQDANSQHVFDALNDYSNSIIVKYYWKQ
ncbi:MAG: 6-bladed beta-propeller [Bacteroidales bacterium]|nr:6-bladed beta-propeller [Bacteroidales bacterium]